MCFNTEVHENLPGLLKVKSLAYEKKTVPVAKSEIMPEMLKSTLVTGGQVFVNVGRGHQEPESHRVQLLPWEVPRTAAATPRAGFGGAVKDRSHKAAEHEPLLPPHWGRMPAGKITSSPGADAHCSA